jgi:anaerobic selenocysteine-containing dehydrogenase
VVEQLKSGALDVAFADPDNPVNWPRNLIVWRANLIGTSAKGHEYFLKHLLGAQNGVMQEGGDGNNCKEVKWHEKGPTGKLDLMVDINFRLNSTGAYSDIILPTATWYEKNDLNTTDMHPFIHPLGEAVSRAGNRNPTGRFSRPGEEILQPGRQAPGREEGSGGAAHAARFRLRNGAALGQVKDWKTRRVRADSGQDHAAAQTGGARLRQHLQQVHRPRPVDDSSWATTSRASTGTPTRNTRNWPASTAP